MPNLHTYEPVQDGEKSFVIYKQSEVEILGLAYKIPPFKHKDRIKFEAISQYLSGGKSSL